MSSPRVSIVIPTYNRAHLLEKSIGSVETQTFRDFEIIVVDDGSSDNTEAVVAARASPHLRYLRHPENCGANAARNTGIRAARGSLVAFQDSDDRWHPEKLARQIATLESHSAEIAFCAMNRCLGDRQQRIPKPGYNIKPGCQPRHEELLRGSFISCQTLLASRELLEQAGCFDEDMPRLQDWDLCLRLAKLRPILFLDEVLVDMEIQADSISNQSNNYAQAADRILKKYKEDFRGDPAAAAMLCSNVGIDALRRRQFGKGLAFTLRGVAYAGIHYPAVLKALYDRR